SVTAILSKAFQSCDKLAKVIMGSGVKSIASYAFSQCVSLTDIYYVGSQSQWGEISINTAGNSRLSAEDVTIHYNSKMAMISVSARSGGVDVVISTVFPDSAILCAASYTEEGQMIQFAARQLTAAEVAEGATGIDLDMSGASCVTVFLLKADGSVAPMAQSKTILLP
ncbi:MAG: leucine-rich repeat protein, partial [Oscillospiraceae bacterium]|nr:leucine-rich repeat protein [Oscillospiraceae bacterium]